MAYRYFNRFCRVRRSEEVENEIKLKKGIFKRRMMQRMGKKPKSRKKKVRRGESHRLLSSFERQLWNKGNSEIAGFARPRVGFRSLHFLRSVPRRTLGPLFHPPRRVITRAVRRLDKGRTRGAGSQATSSVIRCAPCIPFCPPVARPQSCARTPHCVLLCAPVCSC